MEKNSYEHCIYESVDDEWLSTLGYISKIWRKRFQAVMSEEAE